MSWVEPVTVGAAILLLQLLVGVMRSSTRWWVSLDPVEGGVEVRLISASGDKIPVARLNPCAPDFQDRLTEATMAAHEKAAEWNRSISP